MLSTESNWKCSITAEQDKELWPHDWPLPIEMFHFPKTDKVTKCQAKSIVDDDAEAEARADADDDVSCNTDDDVAADAQ